MIKIITHSFDRCVKMKLVDMNLPCCFYGAPKHKMGFYVLSKEPGAKFLTARELAVLRDEARDVPDLVGVRQAACAEDGFEWDGTPESAAWWAKRVNSPTTFDTPFHIRACEGRLAYGKRTRECTLLRCKFGTPFRKLYALMVFMQSRGYTIVATRGFRVDVYGRCVHKKGDVGGAPPLRRMPTA
jgi:hypothetical protein